MLQYIDRSISIATSVAIKQQTVAIKISEVSVCSYRDALNLAAHTNFHLRTYVHVRKKIKVSVKSSSCI